MDRNEGPKTALILAFLRDLYLGNKMDRLEGYQTALTIALLRGF
jgi:hypothetical protein